MRWILYAIVAALQVADVVTTEIGRRTVVGFYEVNPIVVLLAGQPPAVWKLVVLKVLVLAFVAFCIHTVGDSKVVQGAMGLAVVAYAAIIWNNIGVIG